MGGCARNQSASSTGSDENPAGRKCQTAELPALLPAAGELLDSAALVRDLRALQAVRDSVSGSASLSLAYDANGVNIRRQLIKHNLSRSVADSVQKLVFAHRKTLEPGEEWGVRLTVELADAIHLEIARQTVCKPELRSNAGLPTQNRIEIPRRSQATTSLRRTVRVRVLVGENGLVNRADVDRVGMDSYRENQLLNFIYSLTFRPGLEDGVAVPAWTTVTIRGLVF